MISASHSQQVGTWLGRRGAVGGDPGSALGDAIS